DFLPGAALPIAGFLAIIQEKEQSKAHCDSGHTHTPVTSSKSSVTTSGSSPDVVLARVIKSASATGVACVLVDMLKCWACSVP
ncbi:Transcription activator of gluconeogenesis, partial [Clarias magur]